MPRKIEFKNVDFAYNEYKEIHLRQKTAIKFLYRGLSHKKNMYFHLMRQSLFLLLHTLK